MIQYYISQIALTNDYGVELDGISPVGIYDLVFTSPCKITAFNPIKLGFKSFKANFCILKVETDSPDMFLAVEALPNIFLVEDSSNKRPILNRLSEEGVDVTGLPNDAPLVDIERRIMLFLQERDVDFNGV